MARISTYPIDGTITSADKLVGTDGDNVNATVNFNVDDIKAYVLASSTVKSILAGNGIAISSSSGNVTLSLSSVGPRTLGATALTVSAGQSISIAENVAMLKLNWQGSAGTAVINLPQAGDNVNRTLKFISNSTFASDKKALIKPSGSNTLNGQTAANASSGIVSAYGSFQVWSDGTEWYLMNIQAGNPG